VSGGVKRPAAQLPLALGHRPAMGREDFLVAPSNAEAVAWIDRWPDWPSPAVVITGPPGSGKTHLGAVWRARAGARAVGPGFDPVAAEMEDVTAAGGAWLVDAADADVRAGDDALFHLFNRAAERGGHLLVTARTPPARWQGRLPDLVSRLAAATHVAIRAPDETLIEAVLVKLFGDRQLDVDAALITWLVRRIERSFDAARQTVDALDKAALARHRPVSVPLAREVLERGEEG